jgi:signal transduction histidine kinase
MQRTQELEEAARFNGAECKRVEAAVGTLAALGGRGESLAEMAHDARNMVAALGLYCDLLEEPGVLTAPFHHYGSELRLVSKASRQLVEKLVALGSRDENRAETVEEPGEAARTNMFGDFLLNAGRSVAGAREHSRRWEPLPPEPIDDLAAELYASRNLLAALAGPAIAVTVKVEGGAKPVRLTCEDLTRVLVNLVKNAAEAMPRGGGIQLGLRERPAEAGGASRLVLTVEDDGPGIPGKALERIFDAGYTTSSNPDRRGRSWTASHRGLGLAISRSILEAAGGCVRAINRVPTGARFEIELPTRER